MQVQVSRVDLDGRKIDFRLVRPGDDLVPRALRDKGLQDPAQRGQGKKAKSRGAERMAPGEQARSPIQALKASVKKAVARKKGKDKGKARR